MALSPTITVAPELKNVPSKYFFNACPRANTDTETTQHKPPH
jgi:hypothetical protein